MTQLDAGEHLMQSRTIRRAGTPLHALWKDGEGFPLVIVPGALADAQAFVPVAEALGRPDPVLILDRRGRGGSGGLGADYGLEVEVQDLLAWMDALGSPVRLFGWSYGGTIVIETATRALVKDLVAYEPGLGPFGVSALPRLHAADADMRVEIVNREISQVSAQEVAELRASPAWPYLVGLAGPVAAELEAMNAFDPARRWEDLRAQLILGELNRSGTHYAEAFARVERKLPLARTTILSGQGHLAHAADPAGLGRLIGTLLGS